MMASGTLLVVGAARRHWQHCFRQYSSITKGQAADEAYARRTWKSVSLFVALPIVGYVTWQHVIVGRKHHEQRDKTLLHNPKTNLGPGTETAVERVTLTSWIGELWMDYFLEDPKERDKIRWKHLHQMQKRKEEYLAKKQMREEPIQPMDFHNEVKATPVNPIDSGINN